MKKYLVVVLLLIAVPSLAADNLYYVRAGATGTGTGADWTNAYTTLPAVLSRGTTGATYYIADGNYEGYLFNSTSALADGKKIITIKKATVADHGTDTGWDNGYGDGQAVFQYSDYGTVAMAGYKLSTFKILTSYITIDGAVGSGSDPDDYGFKLVMAPGFGGTAEGYADRDQWNAVTIGAVGQSSLELSDIKLQHLAAPGPIATKVYGCFDNKTCSNSGIDVYLLNTGSLTNLTIQNVLSTHWNNNFCVRRTTNFLMENCYASTNYGTATGDHTQNINLDGISNGTIRNSTIVNSHTFAIGIHQNNATTNFMPISDLKIYNNVFQGGAQNSTVTGFITTMKTDPDTIDGDIYVHHNTIISHTCGGKGFVRIGPITNGSMAYVYNNLIYNSTDCVLSNPAGTAGVITHDYNAYLASTGYTAETHGQVDPEAESPFNTGVYTISTTWDAAQVSEEKASLIGKGKTLASPFDIDRAGVSRTAPFDIGAYDVGGSADATAPTLAEVTPVTASSSNQAPSYVFSADEAGTVTYGGTCGNGSLSTAVVGNNTVEWNLGIGTYSNCTITVTDAALNASSALSVTSFTITPEVASAAKTIEGGVTFQQIP